jgi:drug/metabolite transporter (DMT)-like permease
MAGKKDYLLLHFIVFLWGFTAVLGKLVSIPVTEMIFLRSLLAAAGLGALMWLLRQPFRISRRDAWILFGIGAIVAVHWLFFFISGRISNPSTSLVGFATCSLWAALLEPLTRRQPLRALDVAFGLVVLAGLGIIVSFDFAHLYGLWLGVASGFLAALFSVLNARLVHRISAYTITFYQMAGAALFIALCFPLYLRTWSPTGVLQLGALPSDWLYIAVLAWACSVFAFATAINLTKKLSVFFIQLTLNLEPVYGMALALLVFGSGEVMPLHFYIGTAVILASVVAYPILKKKLYPDAVRI